jgi:zeaxanthin epoxidase
VQRRDVYDVLPNPWWVDGRVALLGDSAHAVQPNLGQGGGQAIESAYALADELAKVRWCRLTPSNRSFKSLELTS